MNTTLSQIGTQARMEKSLMKPIRYKDRVFQTVKEFLQYCKQIGFYGVGEKEFTTFGMKKRKTELQIHNDEGKVIGLSKAEYQYFISL